MGAVLEAPPVGNPPGYENRCRGGFGGVFGGARSVGHAPRGGGSEFGCSLLSVLNEAEYPAAWFPGGGRLDVASWIPADHSSTARRCLKTGSNIRNTLPIAARMKL